MFLMIITGQMTSHYLARDVWITCGFPLSSFLVPLSIKLTLKDHGEGRTGNPV